MTEDKLTQARQKIDQVDDAIYRLLEERERQVQAVNAAKREMASSPVAYRPFREASMMRALRAKHGLHFPYASTEHLWREIIAGFTQVQQAYRVHLLDPDFALYDFARFQFGFSTELVRHQSFSSLLEGAKARAADLVFLPIEGRLKELTELCTAENFRILSRLPFFSDQPSPPTFVLGRAEPEEREAAEYYYLTDNSEQENLAPSMTVLSRDESLLGKSLVASAHPASQLEMQGLEWLGSGPSPRDPHA